ncbi:hypothetical protein PGTUg99_023253 [Puccinia graminis f. sp. tritici]|uniref:Uncharacterized protein n=1 Tax=Puccinia graminis f. sp. tritici TaxID=56615 RepID=A0A5B0RPD0_PUCGR|nr:hypothetical protein PGTUg99_023253 [Puccinia graminis f. sp. tritici]
MLLRAKGWLNNESTQTAQLHAHGCFSLLQTSPDAFVLSNQSGLNFALCIRGASVAFAILFAIRCSPIRRCLYLPVSLFFTPLQSTTAPGYLATLSNFRLTKSTILPLVWILHFYTPGHQILENHQEKFLPRIHVILGSLELSIASVSTRVSQRDPSF